ncbi:MAG: TonB-dependent receptor plug domain-containing protein [Bacteroidetes bacterium]|nr:TonB-dependent receptor plug domain-containing protein [Bacteroidota bacterium]
MKLAAVHIIAIFILFGSGISLHAQEKLNDTLRIKAVSIRGNISMTSANIRQVDSLEIQNNQGGSLADLLAKNAPVFIKTAAPGSLATISMRGTLASHTQVSWNGIRINSPMLGQVDFSLIPIFFTDQIQILSGPVSTLKGSGGLGGHIDLASHGKWGEAFYGSLTNTIGSFKTYRILAEAGGGGSSFQTRVRLFHEQSENDFPFLNTANGLFNRVKQQNADFSKKGLMVQAFYQPNAKHLIGIHAWLQSSNRSLPPIMSYEGIGRNEYQNDSQIRISANWQFASGGFNSKLTSGITVDRLDYYLAHQTGGGLLVNYQTESISQSIFNNYQGSLYLSEKHKLKVHIHGNYHKVEIIDQKSGSGYNADRGEIGIQVMMEQFWTNHFKTYALIQQDWIQKSEIPLIPSIGLAYQFIPNLLELKASAGRNFHLPTLNDLYWIPGGNPDLLPEEGYLADIGLHAMLSADSIWRLEAEITGFASYIDYWILWKPGEFRYWSPQNLNTVLIKGFETSIHTSVQLNKIEAKLRANYTLTHTNQLDSENNTLAQLIYIPIHKATVFLHLARNAYYLNYSYTYTSERFTSTEEEFSLHSLPAFSLHQISLGRKQALLGLNTDLHFQINNLFNADYQSILWRAMPGRHYSINLTIQF